MKPALVQIRLSCETCDRTIDAWARMEWHGEVHHYVSAEHPPYSKWSHVDPPRIRYFGVSFPPNPDGSPSGWTWDDAVGARCPDCSTTPPSGTAGER